MSIQITHLGSGSRGNSTLLRNSSSSILVDCGFSLKQTEKRLGSMGVDPFEIDAILVTHNHKDHSGSALNASKKWGSELFCNIGTANRMEWQKEIDCSIISNLERVDFGDDLSIVPVPVPHDGSDNVAVIASDRRGNRAAVVTDLGEATEELVRHLRNCSHISIESNYDHSKLMEGPYPDSLKRRISGRGGHLSNLQTSEILAKVCHRELESVVLCHLSEKNNAPHLAESEVLMGMGENFKGEISISKQDGPEFSHWTGQLESERLALV